MRNKTGYDLNSLLKIANIIICAIGIYVYYEMGDNQYVNGYTLLLLCIFGVANVLVLSIEKKKRDPFILLLMVVATVFYMVRIVSMLYDPWSSVYAYLFVAPDDLNHCLVFILLSNASIVLGLRAPRGKIIYKESILTGEHPASLRNILIILLVAFIANSYSSLAADFIGRFAGYITNVFLQLALIVLMTFVYFAIDLKKNSRRHIRYVIILVIIGAAFVISLALQGSRSGILMVAIFLLIAFLSVKGMVTLSKKSLLILAMLVPLSAAFFAASTYIRIMSMRDMSTAEKVTIIRKSNMFDSTKTDLLRPIFRRTGFLDYATDIIRNREPYSQFIDIQYYFKSIIDNVLTPGFNIFHTPRASQAITAIYRDGPALVQKDIAGGSYQSNMFTAYGEFYILFGGYPALLAFFMASYIFKISYLSIRNKDVFLFYLYRAVILYVFWVWLNSFGMDWMVFNIISIVLTVGLFKNFYKMRRRKLKPIDRSRELAGDASS